MDARARCGARRSCALRWTLRCRTTGCASCSNGKCTRLRARAASIKHRRGLWNKKCTFGTKHPRKREPRRLRATTTQPETVIGDQRQRRDVRWRPVTGRFRALAQNRVFIPTSLRTAGALVPHLRASSCDARQNQPPSRQARRAPRRPRPSLTPLRRSSSRSRTPTSPPPRRSTAAAARFCATAGRAATQTQVRRVCVCVGGCGLRARCRQNADDGRRSQRV